MNRRNEKSEKEDEWIIKEPRPHLSIMLYVRPSGLSTIAWHISSATVPQTELYLYYHNYRFLRLRLNSDRTWCDSSKSRSLFDKLCMVFWLLHSLLYRSFYSTKEWLSVQLWPALLQNAPKSINWCTRELTLYFPFVFYWLFVFFALFSTQLRSLYPKSSFRK